MINSTVFPLSGYTPVIAEEKQMWNIYTIYDEGKRKKLAAHVLKVKFFPELAKFFLYNVAILLEVQCPSVIKYYGFNLRGFNLKGFQFNSSPTLVVDYLKNKSLNSVIENIFSSFTPYGWTSTKTYINLLGIAYGMKYIHSKNIIRRSLSPKSILLDDHFYPHISDFFFAKPAKGKINDDFLLDILNNEDVQLESDENDIYSFNKAINDLWNETSLFQSPEVLLRSSNISFASDIYSFAILAYMLLAGINEKSIINYLTDDNKVSFLESICKNNKRPDLKKIPQERKILEEKYHFFTKCWSKNPSERWSIDQIISFLEKPEVQKAIAEDIDLDEVEEYIENLKVIGNNKTQDITYADTLRRAADNGDCDAMFNYANLLCSGKDKDDTNNEDGKMIAKYYYKNAADKGHMNAMNSYGKLLCSLEDEKSRLEGFNYFKMFMDRKKIELIHNSNHEKIALSIEDAASEGNVYAQYFYGKMLYNGDGVGKNKEEAAQYFKKAADAGLLISILRYADMVYKGDGIKINKNEAIHYYEKAANLGSPEAKCKYGRMLFEGDAVKRNRQKAAEYIKDAADHGNTESMNFYGYMLSNGFGTKTDKYEALKYYKKASDRGNLYAMHNYGNLLQQGYKLTPEDEENITNSNSEAEDNIVPSSSEELNTLYYKFEESICFYKIAADRGDKESMLKYGNALYEEAIKYYTMALKE
ncbi:hypothetical protein M9Y10_006020 [Tritrichomonas musculus]|uniref:Protein kinase domain-containing protein n=1 Tax=Tritrichomonas musculus TaxID=1915356 RepID=A0ABR2JFW1_9EUKA